MIIHDNSIQYDTDFIDSIKDDKRERTSVERDILMCVLSSCLLLVHEDKRLREHKEV